MSKRQQIGLNQYVSAFLNTDRDTAGDLALGIADGELVKYLDLEDGAILKGELSYPVEVPFLFTLNLTDHDRIGDLLWDIAQEYHKLYATANEDAKPYNPYGLCCHGIEDLVFEMLVIEGDELRVFMGS